jgi:uncharacterized protein YehS (DUF1456 family)
MTNNDVLRALRHALELTPSDFVAFFAESGKKVELEAVAAMLKEDDEPGFLRLDDASMGRLLDGLIANKRGRREGEVPAPMTLMNNNRILRALRIAFELKDIELTALMQQAGREVTKAELGALFRREDHRNFQPCGDQFLRAFLRGLGLWHKQGKMR